ncbi:MAG TPA: hypothetical protein VG276_14450 [Actinomycetes bacterium]|nr:hypothetical protein [Actinomycetes bacterium]
MADRASRVLLRVHRIGRNGIRVAAERSYLPGLLRDSDAKQRSDLALDMVDGVSCRGSVVICGPAYGCSPRFLDGLAARGLDAVVEVRPSRPVAIGQGAKVRGIVLASELLDRAR